MLIPVKLNDTVKNNLQAKIPDSLIKVRKGARNKNLSYISGSTCIEMLNNIFNYAWDWKIDNYFIQPSEDLFTKEQKQKGEAPVRQPPVAHVIGTLTVYLKNDDAPPSNNNFICIKKTAAGSKVILGGVDDQQHVFKAASTDALKKAASMLGIGIDLYQDEETQLYFDDLYAINNLDNESKERLKQESIEYIKEIIGDDKDNEKIINEELFAWSNRKFSNINSLDVMQLDSFVKYLKQNLQ